MAGLGGTGLWGWSQLNQPDALIQRIQLSVMPLPLSLESGELAKLDVKDKALLAQGQNNCGKSDATGAVKQIACPLATGAGISPATPA